MPAHAPHSRPRSPITSWKKDTHPTRAAVTTALGITLCAGTLAPAMAQDAILELEEIAIQDDSGEGLKVDRSADKRYTAELADTAKSVTVISEQQIEERNATTLEEIFRTTPGITMAAGEGGQPNSDRPVIRGREADGAVSIDGLRDSGAQTRGTFNLEQVEVVMGADSAMSGRGTAGGSINLVTKSARADDFTDARATIGNDSNRGAAVDTNWQLNDTTAARLNLTYGRGDTPGRNGVWTEEKGAAATMTFGLGTNFRTTIAYEHYETDGMPDYGLPFDQSTNRPAAVNRDNFYGLAARDFQRSQDDTATLRLEYDMDNGMQLSNILRYSKSSLDYMVTNPDDSRGNVANGYVWRNVKSRGSEDKSWTNQLLLTGDLDTGALQHSFATGFEASIEKSSNLGYSTDTGSSTCDATNVGAPSNYLCAPLDNPNPNDPWQGTVTRSDGTPTTGKTRTLSAYIFDTITFGPRWQANLGLRYDDFHVERTSSGRGGDYSGVDDSAFFTGQASIGYKPSENGLIYLSYATSATPSGSSNGDGGGDNLSTDTENLDPTQTRSLELGTKWEVMDDQLLLSAALFENRTTNARVSAGRGQPVETVGESVVRGFELGAAGQVTDALGVFAGYTFMNSEILADADGSTVGNELPNAPEQSFSLWATYDATDKLRFGAGATYQSSIYTSGSNTRELPSWWRYDAMVNYEVTDNFGVRLNVNNITDELYFDSGHSVHFAVPAPGRSISLTANVTF